MRIDVENALFVHTCKVRWSHPELCKMRGKQAWKCMGGATSGEARPSVRVQDMKASEAAAKRSVCEWRAQASVVTDNQAGEQTSTSKQTTKRQEWGRTEPSRHAGRKADRYKYGQKRGHTEIQGDGQKP